MESLTLIGVLLGVAGGVSATISYYNYKNNRKTSEQSVLLLEKIKQVCKLITVEGEFSEIYTHHDAKKILFNLFSFEKKALIIIKAKVLVGFDLTKIHINIDKDKKQVSLSSFPDPEILSIETDLNFYDFQKGIMNKFSEGDLTIMNQKAKDFIREKAQQSELIHLAKHQSGETVAIIRQLIESVGWELNPEKTFTGQEIQNKLQG